MPCSQLDPASREALVVDRTNQLAIQPWGGNLQNVGAPRHSVLHIEDRAHLPAQVRAILVRHPAGLVDSAGGGLINSACGGLINDDAKHASLASAAQLDFHHLQPAGGGHALRDRAHPFDIKSHETSNLLACRAVPKHAETKKWACAHWCVSPRARTTQQFPNINIRRSEAKDNASRQQSYESFYAHIPICLNRQPSLE